jgi:hypothetical protein
MPFAVHDSDSMLEVEVGVPFDVRLGAVPGSGYGWEIAHLPPGVELLGAGPVDDGISAERDDQVFRLVAGAPGRLELRFLLKRRWEQEPIEIRVVEVEAR